MKQWLENHNGQLPSEDQWKEWSLTDRVYDFDNDDDVTAALDIFDDEFMLDGVTTASFPKMRGNGKGGVKAIEYLKPKGKI